MPDVYKTVVTKSNLQYYNGKLKRQIDDLGTVKKLRVGAVESETKTNDNNTEVLDTDHYWLMNVYSADRNGVTQYQLANEDGTCDFSDYYNHSNTANNSCVRINAVSDIGGTHLGDVFVYKKPELDSKFQALNGLKFQKVDTNMHPTLEDFTNINRYSTTPNVPSDDEQMNPWFWDNLIALYPYDGELLEYVLTWSKDPDDITADDEWYNSAWLNYASWEFIGSTKQDLTGYLQDGQIEAVDNDYIDYVVDYKYMAEGLYDALGNKISGTTTIIDSSLSAEPIFIANSMMTQVITGVNDAFDPGTNVKTLIINRNDAYAVDGDNFEGMRNLPRIETLVIKCGMTFAGDCFSGCTDLRRIYVYSGVNLTEANLGNCTAKIIYVDP